jgi:hypothetical protein
MCMRREHQVVDVSGVGMFSFNGTLDMLKRFGKGSKHYPERIVHIDDINNSRTRKGSPSGSYHTHCTHRARRSRHACATRRFRHSSPAALPQALRCSSGR